MAARFAEIVQALVMQQRRLKKKLQHSPACQEDTGTGLDRASSGQLLLESGASDYDAAAYIRYMRWQRALRSATRLGRGLLASTDRHSHGRLPFPGSPATPVGSPDVGPPPLLEGCRALLLRTEHWLEVADPRHRYGSNLRPYFDYWVTETSSSKTALHRKTAHAAPSRMQPVASAIVVGKPAKVPAPQEWPTPGDQAHGTSCDGATTLQFELEADLRGTEPQQQPGIATNAAAVPESNSQGASMAAQDPGLPQQVPCPMQLATQPVVADTTQPMLPSQQLPCRADSCCKQQEPPLRVDRVETQAHHDVVEASSPTPSGPHSRGWLGPSHCASAPQLFLEGEEAEVACMSPMMCLTAVGSGSDTDGQILTEDVADHTCLPPHHHHHHQEGLRPMYHHDHDQLQQRQQQQLPSQQQGDAHATHTTCHQPCTSQQLHSASPSPFLCHSHTATPQPGDDALQEGRAGAGLGSGVGGQQGQGQLASQLGQPQQQPATLQTPVAASRGGVDGVGVAGSTGLTPGCVRSRSQEVPRHRRTHSHEEIQFEGDFGDECGDGDMGQGITRTVSRGVCTASRSGDSSPRGASGSGSARGRGGSGECITPRCQLSVSCDQETAWKEQAMSVPHVIRSQSLLAAKQNARVHRSCSDLQQLSEPLGGYSDVNQSRDNFFRWLDYGEGMLVDLGLSGGPSRAKLDTEILTYLTPQELEHYEVVVDRSTGRLVYKLSGEVLHTGGLPIQVARRHTSSHSGAGPTLTTITPQYLQEHQIGNDQEQPQQAARAPAAAVQAVQEVHLNSMSGSVTAAGAAAGARDPPARAQSAPGGPVVDGDKAAPGVQGLRCDSQPRVPAGGGDTGLEKTPKWIYVVDVQGRLYVEAKVRGHFHHSSFLRGGAVLAAGAMLVEHGRLVALTADSGHYHPKPTHFQWFFNHLRSQGADLTGLQGIQFRTKH